MISSPRRPSISASLASPAFGCSAPEDVAEVTKSMDPKKDRTLKGLSVVSTMY